MLVDVLEEVVAIAYFECVTLRDVSHIYSPIEHHELELSPSLLPLLC